MKAAESHAQGRLGSGPPATGQKPEPCPLHQATVDNDRETTVPPQAKKEKTLEQDLVFFRGSTSGEAVAPAPFSAMSDHWPLTDMVKNSNP